MQFMHLIIACFIIVFLYYILCCSTNQRYNGYVRMCTIITHFSKQKPVIIELICNKQNRQYFLSCTHFSSRGCINEVFENLLTFLYLSNIVYSKPNASFRLALNRCSFFYVYCGFLLDISSHKIPIFSNNKGGLCSLATQLVFAGITT